jgi:hypothetical protein
MSVEQIYLVGLFATGYRIAEIRTIGFIRITMEIEYFLGFYHFSF